MTIKMDYDKAVLNKKNTRYTFPAKKRNT